MWETVEEMFFNLYSTMREKSPNPKWKPFTKVIDALVIVSTHKFLGMARDKTRDLLTALGLPLVKLVQSLELLLIDYFDAVWTFDGRLFAVFCGSIPLCFLILLHVKIFVNVTFPLFSLSLDSPQQHT